MSNAIRLAENTILKPGQRRPDTELSDEEMRRMGNYREGGFILELMVEALLSGDGKEAMVHYLRAMTEHFFKQRMIARRRIKPQREICIEVEIPGKRKRVPLYGTPDVLDVGNWVLEEFKCTWKSSFRVANLETDFWGWFVQIKEYCYMLSLIHGRKVLKARLFVYFIIGDYRQSGPQLRQFNMEFSWNELLENHDMLMRYVRKLAA